MQAIAIGYVDAEALGEKEFKSKRRVKIYATDLDEEAINRGRLATYSAREWWF